jgi:dienelactone hydrolase
MNCILHNAKQIVAAALLTVSAGTAAQNEVRGYELEREMPAYLEDIKQELTYPLAWGNSDIKKFSKWRKKARATVFDAMLQAPTPAADYNMKIVAEEHRNGYTARKIQFNLTKYSRVNAYMLVPDGKGPFPAVVLLHDHGAHYTIGKEKMIRPFDVSSEVLEDADKWADNLYGGQYVGDYLAANGYAVISVDAIMWGERGRKEGIDGNKHTMVAGHFQMLGRSWSATINYEDIYTTDFLATLPEVDASRIGCMGCSMGAYRAWMLSSLTDKIKVGVAVCWMVTTDAQMTLTGRKENGGFANCLPGIRRYMDYPHIASIACPKPMFFLSGTRDKLFPEKGVRDAFATMHAVWQSQNADDRLRTELWDMPHECGVKAQEAMLDFFKQWL